MRAIITALALLGALAGCGGGDTSTSTPIAARSDADGIPVAVEVVRLSVDPTPVGVIVSAVARPPTLGWWDARLIRIPTDDPSLYLMEFRLRAPLVARPAGAPVAREVLGGTFLTTQELRGVRTIGVQGSVNRRTVRRR